MFETLSLLPSDPILGLSTAFREDSNPNKVDLGVGVYRNEQGQTPIMAAVAAAQRQRIDNESTKAYTPPAGSPGANEAVQRLVFGVEHPALKDARVSSIQTPGGCGALRVAAELVMRAKDKPRAWVSTPSWANHVPLLGSAGLTLERYPYYDHDRHQLDFEAMLSALAQVPAGDLVVLHASCHNPCGADLSADQWREVTQLAAEKGWVPLIDMAYQGLGQGVEADALGPRLMAEKLPEVMVANSFSKNFGLYRERAGALSLVSADAAQARAGLSQLLSVTRGLYSMPPAHGSALVDIILHSDELTASWHQELTQMRERIAGLRRGLVECLTRSVPDRDFRFIADEQGMFSFLGLSEAQVERLRREHSIYMTGDSRINVAGLTQENLGYVGAAVAAVID